MLTHELTQQADAINQRLLANNVTLEAFTSGTHADIDAIAQEIQLAGAALEDMVVAMNQYMLQFQDAAKAAKRAGTAKENYTPPHTQGFMSGNLYASQRPQEDHTKAEVALVVK